jgi:predicted acetyltransferase
MSHVFVSPASESEWPLLGGLFQFYAYDFSELEPAGSVVFEVNGEGRFEPYPYLRDYWSAGDRRPLLIRTNARTAGFALINTPSHQGGNVERSTAEFFVARKYRRQGVATMALHQILRLHPGQWEVAVAERNLAAKLFGQGDCGSGECLRSSHSTRRRPTLAGTDLGVLVQ